MAAGLVAKDFTTSAGETFTALVWVPDTGSPDVNAKAIKVQFDTGGNEVLTAAQVVTLLGHLDGVETLLTAIDGRVDGLEGLATTLNGLVDGVEALIGTTNSSLTTLAGYLDGVETALAAATPAGTALIGKVSGSQETSTVYNGTTALTPKFAVVSESSSGNNEVVAAVTGKKIRVLAWDVSPSDTVNFKWRSASTDITGLYYAANAGNGVARAFNPVGYFETASDEALNINLSGAVAVGGSVVYVEV